VAELTVDQLFEKYTSEQQYKEANQAPTVRTGAYRLKEMKVEARLDDRENTPTPGRQYARIQAALHDRESGARKGTVFFNVSWEPVYRENRSGERKLDSAAKLWGQLLKALDVSALSVGQIVKEAIPNYPVDAFVDESFRMPDGGFKSYRGETEDEREKNRRALVDEGGEPINFVQSIFKVRA
jgi:hypothetical protein